MTQNVKPDDAQQLQHALSQHRQILRRLNRVTLIASIILALVVSVIAANHNLYSLVATFIATLVLLNLAAIWQRSLALLLPLIILFCLGDNYLSHPSGFDHPHFLLQLIPLVVFTGVFKISRPYLVQWLSTQQQPQIDQ